MRIIAQVEPKDAEPVNAHNIINGTVFSGVVTEKHGVDVKGLFLKVFGYVVSLPSYQLYSASYGSGTIVRNYKMWPEAELHLVPPDNSYDAD